MPQIIVGHRPWWRTPLLAVGVLTVSVGGAYMAYAHGLEKGVKNTTVRVAEAAAEAKAKQAVKVPPKPEKNYRLEFQTCETNMAAMVEASKKQIAQLQKDARKARAELVETKSSVSIDQNALNWAQTDIKRLQSQKMKLTEELEFMRSIVYPQASRTGLRLYDVDLRKSKVKQVFHYKLTLLQTLKDNSRTRRAEGVVRIKVHGVQNKKAVVLPFSKVSMQKAASLNFKFKHHQNLVGDIKLPKGFVPSRIQFKVVPKRRRAGTISQTYDWAEIVNES